MVALIYAHPLPNEPITLEDVLNIELPFKIPAGAIAVRLAPDVFIQGEAEYFYAIDSWLVHQLVGTSEESVSSLDSYWMSVIQSLLEHLGWVIYRNQTEFSSKGKKRADFVAMVKKFLLFRGES